MGMGIIIGLKWKFYNYLSTVIAMVSFEVSFMIMKYVSLTLVLNSLLILKFSFFFKVNLNILNITYMSLFNGSRVGPNPLNVN